HFYDTVFAINPNGEWRGLLNFDYGQENNPGSFPSRFYGWMGAVRMPISNRWTFSPRYEWYKDAAGLITGHAQTLQEGTLTLQYQISGGVLARFEHRYDWSNRDFFDRGNEPRSTRRQPTLLVGLVIYVGTN